MRTFSINNKLYRAVPFDFNLVIDLQENGIEMSDIQKKPLSVLRIYLAKCGNFDTVVAGKELEAHLIGGGSFDALLEVVGKELDESDFFQHLFATTQTENQPSESEK